MKATFKETLNKFKSGIASCTGTDVARTRRPLKGVSSLGNIVHLKFIFTTLLLVSTNSYAGLWAWENDGATKWLNPDQQCGCYFSLDFSEKVTPKSASHFDHNDISYQIVSLPISIFKEADIDSINKKEILKNHMEYEFGYLEGVVKGDGLTVKEEEWIEESSLYYWNLMRQNESQSSYLVTFSKVSDNCVFYITSMINSEGDISKAKDTIEVIISTLKIHKPKSKEEFDALIADFKPSK